MGTFTVSYFAKKALWDKRGYWLASVAAFYFGHCWEKAGMYKAEMMKGHSRMYASRIASVPEHSDAWKTRKTVANIAWQPLMLPGRHGFPMGQQPMLMAPAQDSEEDDRESEGSIADPSEIPEHADTYEPDENLVNARLAALYPALAADGSKVKGFLPTSWNQEDKSRYLAITRDGLRVTHRTMDNQHKAQQNQSKASAVRANNPITATCGIYYFEIFVKESPTGCLGFGVCQQGVDTSRLPGWDRFSYGYHGDDGFFFNSDGTGTQYGEKFGTGDTVGCGVNLIENHIFFTKNGVHQGVAMVGLELSQDLFPVLGMQSPHEKVDANFGQLPFVFDIQEQIEKTREVVNKQITEVDLHILQKRDWCHRIVANFLQTEGYSQSFAAFKAHVSDAAEEPIDMIQARRKIMDLIIAHKPGDAIQMIKTYFPQMNANVEKRRQAMLLLKIQNFVETAYEFVIREAEHRSKSTANGSANGNASNGNAANHPSTSQADSSHKRSLSHHSDNDAPTRKIPTGRVSVASRLSADQPCSSKNGSANGNGVACHAVEFDADETENGTCFEEEGPHRHDMTREDQNRVAELLQMGREITEEAQCRLIYDEYLLNLVEVALPCLYLSKPAFKRHKLRRRGHIASVARKVNKSIMESFHEETGLRGIVGPTLPRILDKWREKKQCMLQENIAATMFMDDEDIIYGSCSESEYDSDDEEYEYETTDGSDQDDDGESPSSSYTSDSDDVEYASTGEDDEEEDVMDADQPTHSRAYLTSAF